MKRLHVALLVAGLLVLPALIFLLRGSSRPTSDPPVSKRAVKSHPKTGYFVPPEEAPTPASNEEIGQASQSVRLKSTLRNYRTAVAMGNERLSAALRRVLLKDRKSALQLAREELSQASDDRERELAQKTLESLEKKP